MSGFPEPRLTRHEALLLRLLRSYEIVRRAEALAVWGYSQEAQTRTIDVHIRRLRKKGIQIETIFGVGWRLVQPREARPLVFDLLPAGEPEPDAPLEEQQAA